MAKLSKGIAKLSTLATLMISLTLRCTPATTRYYTEPLDDLGEAIPLQMLLIPAGTFTMGSPEDEPKRSQNEAQHKVTVPSFFLGRYPVTQAQWRAVAALPQVKRTLKPAPSHFKGDNRPVEKVSWYEAVEFCDRLQQHTGRPHRLPSEAEWEYACRAGTTTPFHFGKTLTTEVANYDGNYTYADSLKGEYREETTLVDQFELANAFGLCDMHGNVWEWCQDHYGEYDQTPTNGRAWLTDNEQAYRILRGGSWRGYSRNCRAACRSDFTPVLRSSDVGFRVCCAAPKALA
jgi:formylglycine-generating enzyme required for sulfatase activity